MYGELLNVDQVLKEKWATIILFLSRMIVAFKLVIGQGVWYQLKLNGQSISVASKSCKTFGTATKKNTPRDFICKPSG